MKWSKISTKFNVANVEKVDGEDGTRVYFQAVTEGDDLKEFWTSTPSGSIEMQLVRDDVADGFKIGDTYTVEFSRD